MADPDITVIIPVYNRGEAIRETIDSCLNQDRVAIEVLVVDDASSDDSRSVVASYGEPIRLIRLEESHGSGAFARNVGIREARGRYIKFLDHDDVLEPGTLERELHVASQHSADLVMSGWGVVEMGADGKRISETEKTYLPPPGDRVIEAILGQGKTPFTAAVLYRSDPIRQMEWDPKAALYDDFDFFSRAALRAGRIVTSESLAYWWRRREASMQSANAADPLGYFHAERTRCVVYRKVEDILAATGRLTTPRRDLLLARYYLGLRAFSRWDPVFCRDIVGRIGQLAPGWVPPPVVEPSPVVRNAIRLAGLAGFLGIYALLRKLVR